MHSDVASLISDYFARTDQIVDKPGELIFSTDGRMRLGQLRPDGRPAIAAYFIARREEASRTGRKTRHIMSNLIVEPVGESRARAYFQCLVFAGIGDFPLPSAAPATIADFEADCVHSAATGWLIDELRATPTFIGPGAASFVKQEP